MGIAVVFALLFFVSTGCTAPVLYTFTEYICEEDCASSKIGLEESLSPVFLGKQVVINWSLPKKYHSSSLSLLLNVYYSDGEHKKLAYEVEGLSGYKVYRTQELSDSAKEVISYKAVLMADGKEVISSAHHLWTEVIPVTRGGTLNQLN
ncbi:hypothetical protein [Chlamydiifrater volucris]|uniref:hypothetical protein n=1 Tax=Chlamydiifrater volucris TaxID=2681470 RepID=UPI001BCAAB6B|nr:hypothetical protein [Chlamydiifrater volucris]